MPTITDIGTLIVSTPGTCGGRPRIAGHQVTVQNIAIDYNSAMTPEAIVSARPQLNLAQIYAALAYYHANKEEIDAEIAAEQAEWECSEADIKTFKKVKVETENTELAIQSIENKGDGLIVIRVSFPPDANKENIHNEFAKNYQLALKAIEEKYQIELQAKERQSEIYEKQLSDLREIAKSLADTRVINIIDPNLPETAKESQQLLQQQDKTDLSNTTLQHESKKQ